MKLSDWASIAEIASSVAVVVTLVILILEVRGNTAAMEAATRQSIAARTEAITLNTAMTPDLARILNDPNSVEAGTTEGWQLLSFYTTLLRHTEEAYLQWQEGRLDEEYFSRRAAGAFGAMESDAFRDAFEQLKSSYDPGFIGWVEANILSEHQPR